MVKSIHNGSRKAVRTVAHKARAGRRAYVMNPEILALVENFRLMDDNFMSKCLENAPECIELMRRKCISKFSGNESVNSRIQKKGGTTCARLWKPKSRLTRPL